MCIRDSIIAFVLPIIAINEISLNLSSNFKNIFSLVWIVLLLIDVIHMMSQVKKDERERLHEALADRNALWFIMFVLIVSAIYDAFFNQSTNIIFLVAVLGAVIVKSITQFYLRDK
jgi:cobalamin synthase